jgi:hypothetical protein
LLVQLDASVVDYLVDNMNDLVKEVVPVVDDHKVVVEVDQALEHQLVLLMANVVDDEDAEDDDDDVIDNA